MSVFLNALAILIALLCSTDSLEVCEPALKSLAKHGFDPQYIRSQMPSNGTTVCRGGHCCVQGINDQLVSRGRTLVQLSLQDGTYKIQQSLDSAISRFKESFLEAVSNSESTTQHIFQNAFPRLYTHAKEPIASLFTHLKSAVETDPLHKLDISLKNFWDELFPLMFHTTINTRLPPFTPSYVECLKEQRSSIKPWKLLPTLIGDSIIRGMESVYLMMYALSTSNNTIGEVRQYTIPEECGQPAARLYFCGFCHGVDIPPCKGLCLNVARGCLAPMAELDGAWNELINSVVRAEEAIKSSKVAFYLKELPDRLSDAIMVAMQSGERLQKIVQGKCGPYQHEGASVFNSKSQGEKDSPLHPPASSDPTLEETASNAVSVMQDTRGFWAKLADETCEPLKYRDTNCWNGIRASTYSRPAAGIGVSAQKYNPEVQIARPDKKIFGLAEEFRSVKKTISKRLEWMPESYSFQYVEGSASGRTNDNEDDDEYEGGSGSGDGDGISNLVPSGEDTESEVEIEVIGSSTKCKYSSLLGLLVFVLAIMQ